MTTLRNGLVAVRGIASLLVAYEFIRNGAGALTQVAIALHGQEPATWDDAQLALLGLTEVGATFALFALTSLSRIIGAVLLLWCSMATVGGLAHAAIPIWCVALTAILALVPKIPALAPAPRGNAPEPRVWSRRQLPWRDPAHRIVV